MNILAQKVELFVQDVERSASFYVDVLGFERAPTRTVMLAGQELVHAPLRNGPIMLGIGLLSRLPTEHYHRRAGSNAVLGLGVELCLYVADSELETWYARAKAAGDSAEVIILPGASHFDEAAASSPSWSTTLSVIKKELGIAAKS